MSARTQERNGVRTSQNLSEAVRSFRSDLLFFDRIAISEIEYTCNVLRAHANDDEQKRAISDLDWLINAGVLFDPVIDVDKEALPDTPIYRDFRRLQNNVGSLVEQSIFSTGGDGQLPGIYTEIEPGLSLGEANMRIDAALLGQRPGIEAIPIFPVFPAQVSSGEATAAAFLMEISLKNFPVPSGGVEWEEVMDLRSGSIVQEIRHLRRWIACVAQGQVSPEKFQTEATELLDAYRAAIDSQCKKVGARTIRMIVTTTEKFSEFIRMHRPSRRAGHMCTVGIRRMRLMECELKQSRSRKSEQDDKWNFCLTTAIIAASRRDHEQTTAPEPHTGFQGEGGACRRQGRPDDGPTGRAL